MQVADADVARMLTQFSLRPLDDIADIVRQQTERPESRVAQRALAREMTLLVHGADRLAGALKASEVLFGGSLEGLTAEEFQDVAGEAPHKALERDRLNGAGFTLIDALVHAGLATSKGQARKDVEGGGIYVNNVRVNDAARDHGQIRAFHNRTFDLAKAPPTSVVIRPAVRADMRRTIPPTSTGQARDA